MVKDSCIINPKTGRAVNTSTPLGKKLLNQAEKLDKEYNARLKLKAAAKRALVKKPQPDAPKAPPKAAPKAPPKAPPKPKAESKPKAPPKAPPKPKAESKTKAPPKAPPKPKAEPKAEPKVEPKVEPVAAPKKESPAKTKKYDMEYIKRYAAFIVNKYSAKDLAKLLEKAKNGDEVKDIYSDYVTPLRKSIRTLRILLDDEDMISPEQKKDILYKNRESKLYDGNVGLVYYNFEEDAKLRYTQQTYLFKFEEPAE